MDTAVQAPVDTVVPLLAVAKEVTEAPLRAVTVVLLLVVAREVMEAHPKAVTVVPLLAVAREVMEARLKAVTAVKSPAQATDQHLLHSNLVDTVVPLLVDTEPQLVKLAQVTVNNQAEAHTEAQAVLSQAVTEVPLPSNRATAVLRNLDMVQELVLEPPPAVTVAKPPQAVTVQEAKLPPADMVEAAEPQLVDTAAKTTHQSSQS